MRSPSTGSFAPNSLTRSLRTRFQMYDCQAWTYIKRKFFGICEKEGDRWRGDGEAAKSGRTEDIAPRWSFEPLRWKKSITMEG